MAILSRYVLTLAFFAILQLSFALIDPPVQSVHEHNLALVAGPPNLSSVLRTNVLGYPENPVNMYQPVRFFYTKILALTPSVNYSVSSDQHPQMVYLIAMDYEQSFPTDYSHDGCPGEIRTREYGTAELQQVRGSYSLSGIIHQSGNVTTYETASTSESLVDSILDETLKNPVRTPFERSPVCSIADSFNALNVLGGFNISCQDDSLSRASAYSNEPVNLSHRLEDLNITYPRLTASVWAQYAFPYTDTVIYHVKKADGSCDDVDATEYGHVMAGSNSDTVSYEVQNGQMTIVSASPGFMRFDLPVNTSQDVVYQVGVLSNADIYKAYTDMDGRTAAANYFYNFSIVNGAYNSQHIVAYPINLTGALPGDPNVHAAYAGSSSSILPRHANYLLDGAQTSGVHYNHSRVYAFQDSFYNLSPGAHTVDYRLYSWLGQRTATSHLNVRLNTNMQVIVQDGLGETVVTCQLTGPAGPVSGVPVLLSVNSGLNQTVYTDSSGKCRGVFNNATGLSNIISARFLGSDTYSPSSDYKMHLGSLFVPMLTPPCYGSLSIMIILCVLFGGSILRYANDIHGVFFGTVRPGLEGLFAVHAKSWQDQKAKKDAEEAAKKEKKKQLAKQIILAVATGGAGAAAGGAAAGGATGASGAASGAGSASGTSGAFGAAKGAEIAKAAEKYGFWSDIKKAQWQMENDPKWKLVKGGAKSIGKSKEEKEMEALEELSRERGIAGKKKENPESGYLTTFVSPPEDQDGKPVFEKLWKKYPDNNQREKLRLLKSSYENGTINKKELKTIVESNVTPHRLDQYLKTGDGKFKQKVVDDLHGQMGTSKADDFFRRLGCETETEVIPKRMPNGVGEKVLDVVARPNEPITLKYETVDSKGNVVWKEDQIEKAKIVGTESKSYTRSSLEKPERIDNLVGQVSHSANSGNIDRTYAYVTSDFKELPTEKRAEIANKIRNAGGELMVSENSNEANRKAAGILMDKLKEGNSNSQRVTK